ncbi:hypothetical protein B0H10DRAFT_1292391 [Mycena sp. CBHHK59/15]|nr:hypothetical protein B0H10DRAFT_1292391 [Mycena sp. CBHHK59/15]
MVCRHSTNSTRLPRLVLPTRRLELLPLLSIALVVSSASPERFSTLEPVSVARADPTTPAPSIAFTTATAIFGKGTTVSTLLRSSESCAADRAAAGILSSFRGYSLPAEIKNIIQNGGNGLVDLASEWKSGDEIERDEGCETDEVFWLQEPHEQRTNHSTCMAFIVLMSTLKIVNATHRRGWL